MKRAILDFLKGLWFGICSIVGFMFTTLSIVTFCNIHTIEDAWEAVYAFFVAILALAFGVATFVLIGKYIGELENFLRRANDE